MTNIRKPNVSRFQFSAASDARGIEAENKTRQALESTPQRDDQYETLNDNSRCAPSTIVAASALAGGNQMLSLLSGLNKARENGDADIGTTLQKKIEQIPQKYLDRESVTPEQLQQLQEALHISGQLDGDASSTNDAEFANMLSIAGFRGRPARQRVDSEPGTDKYYSQVEKLMNDLKPGEMMTLVVPSPTNPDGLHGILFGLDNNGSAFVYDSASSDPKNCLMQYEIKSEAERGRLLDHLNSVVRVFGQVEGFPNGIVYSASPELF